MKIDKSKGVMWNNVRLMPGSHALELYESNKLRLLEHHMGKLDAEAKARGDTAYIPTGFPAFDKLLAGGLKPGELSVFAATDTRGRTIIAGYRDGKPVYDLAACGGHKTMLILNAALADIRAGRAYGLSIDLEMSDSQVRSRLGLPESDTPT